MHFFGFSVVTVISLALQYQALIVGPIIAECVVVLLCFSTVVKQVSIPRIATLRPKVFIAFSSIAAASVH